MTTFEVYPPAGTYLPSFDAPVAPDASRPAPIPRAPFVPSPGAVCVNAGDDTAHRKRPALHPGPRCATCHREELKARRARAADRHIERNFGMTPEQYDELYRAQGGRCYICRRATGKRKRLAVDHDHALAALHGHPIDKGCPLCWRGLACGPCNQNVLGALGGGPETYERIAADLRDPPARRLFREQQS